MSSKGFPTKVSGSGPRHSRTAGRFLDDFIAPGFCFGFLAALQIGLRQVLEVLYYCRRNPVSGAAPAPFLPKSPVISKERKTTTSGEPCPKTCSTIRRIIIERSAPISAAILSIFLRKIAGKRTLTMGSWPLRGRPLFWLRFPLLCVNTKSNLPAALDDTTSAGVEDPSKLEVSPLPSGIRRACRITFNRP